MIIVLKKDLACFTTLSRSCSSNITTNTDDLPSCLPCFSDDLHPCLPCCAFELHPSSLSSTIPFSPCPITKFFVFSTISTNVSLTALGITPQVLPIVPGTQVPPSCAPSLTVQFLVGFFSWSATLHMLRFPLNWFRPCLLLPPAFGFSSLISSLRTLVHIKQ
ncbi:hypothetical protein RchiOBHm_Chr2g0120441 [Rosa chinensis]|uniref:Uncharacterized protein n=1 Tax=Rosa chinensis TaxID=74649 RepID=A0A2P6RS95_ROSCH|nr:hypothetical protein RchiOBHm_Chr2g0120441 [Rosa chinensis]